MRRLFSTFAQGPPGLGLLLLRLVAGFAVVTRGLTSLLAKTSIETALPDALAIATGLFLVAGLWTPIAGGLLALLALWNISQHEELWANILLGTIGAALALIGPGVWSIDARRFGWKRIDVRERE